MLNGIPNELTPELLKILMEMGHRDEIVIGDGNFPAASMANKLVRCDGHGVLKLLNAILQFFPLDTYCEHPISLMSIIPGDNTNPVIWEDYKQLIGKYDQRGKDCIEYIETYDFYDRAKKAYAIVATSEKALYGCIILKKGVLLQK